MAPEKQLPDTRLPALRRFATAITVLNLLGQIVLGFEPGWIHLVAAITTSYSLEALLEVIDARLAGRPYGWSGGFQKLVDFFLPAHITGLAVAMLLYSGERVWPVVFGVACAIGSKAAFRVPVGKGRRHFLNPSNTGIAAGLLFVHGTGAAPPYQFTEHLTGWQDWALPGVIVCTGTFLNAKLTRKIPLIVGWLGGYLLQCGLRAALFDAWPVAPLGPMTGAAFVLFTNYMISDPATTPTIPRNQILFGVSVALVYGLLRVVHVYFAIFYALAMVCTVRGLYLYVTARIAQRATGPVAVVPVGAPEVAAERLAS